MKDYFEQEYPYELAVIVRYGDNVWEDGIKGLNKGHALYRAAWNWEGAEIKPLYGVYAR